MGLAGLVGASGAASAKAGRGRGRGHGEGHPGRGRGHGHGRHKGWENANFEDDDDAPPAFRRLSEGHPVYGNDIPEPAQGFGGNRPDGVFPGLDGQGTFVRNETRIRDREDGDDDAVIDHVRCECQNDDGSTDFAMEFLAVEDSDGNVALARPESAEAGTLPEELRPNGESN